MVIYRLSAIDFKNGCCHVLINKFCNWPLWWRVSLSVTVQTMLNHIRFDFTTIFELDKERNHWAWKCTPCIMQMSYLHSSDLPFKNFPNSLNMQKPYRNNVWEKSNDAYPLPIRTPKKMFFFRPRAKKALRNTLTRAARYGLLSTTVN